jgi:Zn-finger nucleic acid-binding protein
MTLNRDRDFFHCEYCGAFHFPTPSREGVRLLERATGRLCPVCRDPLYEASLEDYPILACPRCRGFLMAQSMFGDLVKRSRSRATSAPDPPRPLDRAALDRQVDCPLCGESMSTHPYHGPGNIVIDTCRHCHVLWLDYGEFAIVINAPGSDRPA